MLTGLKALLQSGNKDMCLAVPMKLIEKNEDRGIACLGGVKRDVNLMLVPDARPGDCLIVHAGCAIEILDEEEARKTLFFLREIGESV
jgi:hydrogenase expression/formation protein HypC